MFVAFLSLILFGTMLDAKELESGALVLVGLYLSIIGNPSVDRAWQEYMSDLPTNVPQSFTDAAENSVSAAVVLSDRVVDTMGDVKDSVVDTVEDVKESVTGKVIDVKDSFVDKVEDVAVVVQEKVCADKE